MAEDFDIVNKKVLEIAKTETKPTLNESRVFAGSEI